MRQIAMLLAGALLACGCERQSRTDGSQASHGLPRRHAGCVSAPVVTHRHGQLVHSIEKLVQYEGPRVVADSGAHELRAIPDFGDCIVTQADGRALLALRGGGHAQLEPNTHVCVLDAHPEALFLISGDVSGSLDDATQLDGFRLVTNHGELSLSAGAQARVAQRNALDRARDRLSSRVDVALQRGQARLSPRAFLSDKTAEEMLSVPCELDFGPMAPVESVQSALDTLLAQLATTQTSTEPIEEWVQRVLPTRLKGELAAEMSAIEVLSRCAAREEREADCATLTAWRHAQLPRFRGVWFGASREQMRLLK